MKSDTSKFLAGSHLNNYIQFQPKSIKQGTNAEVKCDPFLVFPSIQNYKNNASLRNSNKGVKSF